MDDQKPADRPRAVIFDWDNTLVDSWGVIHESLNRTLARYDLPTWTADEVKTRVRRSMRESFPALFGAAWQEAGDFFLAAFAEIHLDHLRALPGAEAVLRDLHDLSVPAAIVSNKTGRLLRDEVRHLGWENLFVQVVGAADAAVDKPAAEPVRMALAPCAIAPGPDVWFVGDTDIDLQCATNSGCAGVLVRPEPPQAGEFAECAPALHFSGCLALSNFIRTL